MEVMLSCNEKASLAPGDNMPPIEQEFRKHLRCAAWRNDMNRNLLYHVQEQIESHQRSLAAAKDPGPDSA